MITRRSLLVGAATLPVLLALPSTTTADAAPPVLRLPSDAYGWRYGWDHSCIKSGFCGQHLRLTIDPPDRPVIGDLLYLPNHETLAQVDMIQYIGDGNPWATRERTYYVTIGITLPREER